MTGLAVEPRFLAAGDTALVVEFGDSISREVSDRVLALADRIEAEEIPGLVELVPTFRSLMIHYDPLRLSSRELEEAVRPHLLGLGTERAAGRTWHLPVCYDRELGPDLEEVAERTGKSVEDVIALHAAETYHVYAIGFLPGFPYMGDVAEALSLPRRVSPRLKVPMGSICIAQRMAGIYPLESPGGWHLLGRTPVRLFDRSRADAVLLSPGDKVVFKPISRDAFDRLETEVANGRVVLASLAEAHA
jgi:inhibitor of KinA